MPTTLAGRRKVMMRSVGIMLCLFVFVFGTAVALAGEPMSAAEFEAKLQYRGGEVKLPNGAATLRIPENFRYLDPKDTETLLVQGWGNPTGDNTLGMILPADVSPLGENGWGVVITYEQDGYVSDEDADGIDYEELLKEMKKGAEAENKERAKKGYTTFELVGWASKPHYDKATHKLYWAKEIAFGGGAVNTLNYNVRILGRRGVLVLNAVAGMDQLAAIEQDMQQVIAFTDFNPGYRYSDFNAGTDKVATYGLAALVAGGVAAKAGLFAKLLGVLLAAKKLVIAGVVAAVGFGARILGRRKKAAPRT
jgi:uncharacterized membrane-anchored protein